MATKEDKTYNALRLAHECAVRRLVEAGHYKAAMVDAYLADPEDETRKRMAVAAIDGYHAARDLCRVAAEAIKARDERIEPDPGKGKGKV